MAFLFGDSFDHYATADRFAKWTTVLSGDGFAAISSGNGRRSTNSLRFSNNNRGWEKALSPGDATCVIGVAVRFPSISASEFLRISDATVQHLAVMLTAAGAIEVRRGTTVGTILGTTATGLISANTYAYVEVKALIDDTVGTVEVRLNGSTSPALALTGQDTRNAGTAGWSRLALVTGAIINTDFDDLYVLDGTGTRNNTFLGDVRVDAHFPNAEGFSSGSTPSTGTDRSATVDETAPNSDTDYNTVVGVGDRDTLNIENFKGSGAIHAFQVLAFAKKTDAGVGSAAAVVRASGTDHDAAGVALSTSYSYLIEPYDDNPATSAQITDSEFNALQAGYTRTA